MSMGLFKKKKMTDEERARSHVQKEFDLTNKYEMVILRHDTNRFELYINNRKLYYYHTGTLTMDFILDGVDKDYWKDDPAMKREVYYWDEATAKKCAEKYVNDKRNDYVGRVMIKYNKTLPKDEVVSSFSI